jgi:hypothetical protein
MSAKFTTIRAVPKAPILRVVRLPGCGTTLPKQCTRLLPPATASALPMRCESRVYKAGQCLAHWTDWRQAKETRRGAQAVNPTRREKKRVMREEGLSPRGFVRFRKEQSRLARQAQGGVA